MLTEFSRCSEQNVNTPLLHDHQRKGQNHKGQLRRSSRLHIIAQRPTSLELGFRRRAVDSLLNITRQYYLFVSTVNTGVEAKTKEL